MTSTVCSWTTQATWADNAVKLARACVGMLNRADCCGGYRSKPTTRKSTDRDWLSMARALVEHFRGERTIGLHTTSVANVCRWLAFDIDSHDGNDDGGENHNKALTVATRLRAKGLVPYIFDSDGCGGLHVWSMLHRPTPSPEVRCLAQGIAAGLAIESFPKQPQIRAGGYGNWLRFEGHHHSKNHWSRVLLPNGKWGTPEATVAAILRMTRGLTQCLS